MIDEHDGSKSAAVTDRPIGTEDPWCDSALLGALIAHHPGLLFVKRADDLRFVLINRAGEQLVGWHDAELRGKTDFDFYPPEQAAHYVAKDRECLASGTVVETEEVNTSKAGTRWFRTKKIAVPDATGRPRWLLGLSEDITRHKEEQARQERIAALLLGQEDDEPRPASTSMRRLLDAVDLVAKEPHVSVLLLGETGTGKSWLARRIHRKSPRADRPFIEVNCAGLKPELVESELFGHERGAFTGANAQKVGLVEAAQGGTLFLDEVADIPLAVQAQVLTFLDHRRFRRVGGVRELEADVRLVAATNADLKKRVDEGSFRLDLAFRLGVFPLTVPPLRERVTDIPEIARTHLAELAARRHTRAPVIADDAIVALLAYAWPGNVRELRNVLERALIVDVDGKIGVDDLGPLGGARAPASLAPLAEVEWAHIDAVLQAVSGNRTTAAALLGISRSTLKRKLAARMPSRKLPRRRPRAR